MIIKASKVLNDDIIVSIQSYDHHAATLSTHVIASGLVLRGRLDGVGQEAEDGADPQQDGEAAEQLPTKLAPLWGGGGRGQGVGAVPDQVLCCLGVGQTLRGAEEVEKMEGDG